MMNRITPEALEFLDEAKKSFNNIEMATYQNEHYIALRTGLFENCLSVYELGGEVGLFTEVLPRQHSVVIDYKELEDLKKYKKMIDKVRDIITFYENSKESYSAKEVLTSICLQLK